MLGLVWTTPMHLQHDSYNLPHLLKIYLPGVETLSLERKGVLLEIVCFTCSQNKKTNRSCRIVCISATGVPFQIWVVPLGWGLAKEIFELLGSCIFIYQNNK